ncbi:hypothetical protein EBU99_03040 [bacterium]|nr:hypothetical protein [bacterium]
MAFFQENKTKFLLVFVFLNSWAARGDIAPSDDFDSITQNPTESHAAKEQACHWIPQIGVSLLIGEIALPSGPPGFANYKSQSRATALNVDLQSANCFDEVVFARPFVQASLQNAFPGRGRQFDVQAVSWLEFMLKSGLRRSYSMGSSLQLQGQIAIASRYERYQYPRGTFAIRGLPIALGLDFGRDVDFLGEQVSTGISAEFARFVWADTVVSYGSYASSLRRDASQISLSGTKPVSGQNLQLGLDVAFSSGYHPTVDALGLTRQHRISLLWQQKKRSAEEFLLEKNSSGDEISSLPLDLKEETWGIRWSEML